MSYIYQLYPVWTYSIYLSWHTCMYVSNIYTGIHVCTICMYATHLYLAHIHVCMYVPHLYWHAFMYVCQHTSILVYIHVCMSTTSIVVYVYVCHPSILAYIYVCMYIYTGHIYAWYTFEYVWHTHN